jgi:thymidylate synthase ThyX
MKSLKQQKDESDKAYLRRIQSDASDVCRFLLPAASLANVGVTINARALEYAICKMLSSPLSEVQEIGDQLLKVGQKEAPTLIKYAGCNAYLIGLRQRIREIQVASTKEEHTRDFTLADWDADGEVKILAGILCRFGAADGFQKALEIIKGLSTNEQKALVAQIMSDRQRFDQPLREFEYAAMTFEVIMDQGAYYEFKRHRMMTHTVEPLGTGLGYALPEAVVGGGCSDLFETAMKKSSKLYQAMALWNPDAASYIIPNGFNRRVVFMMNLREAFHFCRLRAAENAHFSIRKVGMQMAEKIREIYPLFAPYLDVPQDQTSHAIAEKYFSRLQA